MRERIDERTPYAGSIFDRSARHQRAQTVNCIIQFGQWHAFAAAMGCPHISGTEYDHLFSDGSYEVCFGTEWYGDCNSTGQGLDGSFEWTASGRFKSCLLSENAKIPFE